MNVQHLHDPLDEGGRASRGRVRLDGLEEQVEVHGLLRARREARVQKGLVQRSVEAI